jgi:hypothetical protein
VVAPCEHVDGTVGIIKGEEFLDQLREYSLLKKGLCCRGLISFRSRIFTVIHFVISTTDFQHHRTVISAEGM